MIGIIIFYFIRYFQGKEYNIKFLNQSTLYELSIDDEPDIARNLEFYIAPIQFINTDCKLHPFYIGGFFYDESNLTKCNDNLEIDPKGSYYCYNYSAGSQFYLGISGDCSKENENANEILLYTVNTNIKINHENSVSLSIEKGKPLYNRFHLFASKGSYYHMIYKFTPIIYKSKKIFSKVNDRFKELFLTNIDMKTYNDFNRIISINNETINIIFHSDFELDQNCHIYERVYITRKYLIIRILTFHIFKKFCRN